MEDKFKNGIIDHKVEARLDKSSPAKFYTVVDKVTVPTSHYGHTGQTNQFMVMDEVGKVSIIDRWDIIRIIL